MKKRKFLVLAVASMAMSMMLTTPAFASDNIEVSFTDITGASASEDESRTQEIWDGAAVPYPTDIQLMEQGVRNYLHKTFTVAADYPPDSLVELPFSQGGYHYRYSETIQGPHTPGNMTKTVTDQKTVESASGEKTDILALMGNSLPYSDNDGYKGELFLVPESLTVSETGRESYSYTLTDTRTFDNLDRNDPSYIPKTVQKSGVTLSLQGIDWQVTGSDNMGYSEVAVRYSAIASYSGIATGSQVSGYTATAVYSGEAVKEAIGKSIYTIVYEGEQIIIPFNYIPLIISGAVIAGCIVALAVFLRLRKNLTVYTYQAGVPELYTKLRISPKEPKIDLRQLSDIEIRLVFDKGIAKRLLNQRVFIISKYKNTRFDLETRMVDLTLPGEKNEKSPVVECQAPK